MRSTLLIELLIVTMPATAGWQRRTLTPKGERVDVLRPHPLVYFTQYPSLRDEDHDFCYLCSPEKSLAVAKQRKDRAEVKLVGKVREFTIYDVFYFFNEEREPSWKSILVEIQPGQYREIWHYQRTEGEIWPSYLVKVGDESLLGLEDDCYKQDIVQEYYWFGNDGPVLIDFSPIWRAAKSAVTRDTTVSGPYDGRTDLPAGRMRLGVIRKPDWRCCSPGIVQVNVELHQGRVVAKEAHFEPTAEFQWPPTCR